MVVSSQKALLFIAANDELDRLSEEIDEKHTDLLSQQNIEHRATIVQNMMNNDIITACTSTGTSIMRVESIEHMSEEELVMEDTLDDGNNQQRKK